eukprot:comp19734_c0_seq1/m.23529 comp19734_c0_seq1/g.23529  ORF comp19734_c0_seq1/g.23529 comp19734_c0_seq1/m.23529 type:complete len:221 (-) comp19734_c0_seq1:603-1265(-)
MALRVRPAPQDENALPGGVQLKGGKSGQLQPSDRHSTTKKPSNGLGSKRSFGSELTNKNVENVAPRGGAKEKDEAGMGLSSKKTERALKPLDLNAVRQSDAGVKSAKPVQSIKTTGLGASNRLGRTGFRSLGRAYTPANDYPEDPLPVHKFGLAPLAAVSAFDPLQSTAADLFGPTMATELPSPTSSAGFPLEIAEPTKDEGKKREQGGLGYGMFEVDFF